MPYVDLDTAYHCSPLSAGSWGHSSSIGLQGCCCKVIMLVPAVSKNTPFSSSDVQIDTETSLHPISFLFKD